MLNYLSTGTTLPFTFFNLSILGVMIQSVSMGTEASSFKEICFLLVGHISLALKYCIS
jgi:hypothetical protein